MSTSANVSYCKQVDDIPYDRKCGNCSLCCEGIISGEAYGHVFENNIPCYFLTKNNIKKCSIYGNHPPVCKYFKCEWLINRSLPEWVKPNLSGILIYKCISGIRLAKEQYIYCVVKQDKPKTVAVQQLAMIDIKQWVVKNKLNVVFF